MIPRREGQGCSIETDAFVIELNRKGEIEKINVFESKMFRDFMSGTLFDLIIGLGGGIDRNGIRREGIIAEAIHQVLGANDYYKNNDIRGKNGFQVEYWLIIPLSDAQQMNQIHAAIIQILNRAQTSNRIKHFSSGNKNYSITVADPNNPETDVMFYLYLEAVIDYNQLQAQAIEIFNTFLQIIRMNYNFSNFISPFSPEDMWLNQDNGLAE